MPLIGPPKKPRYKKRLVTAAFRCTIFEANQIRGRAKIYAGGSLSRYLRMALEHYEAKHLSGTDDPKGRGRSAYLRFRVTEKEMHQIRGRAKIYAGGNISLWVRHCAMNNERRLKKFTL